MAQNISLSLSHKILKVSKLSDSVFIVYMPVETGRQPAKFCSSIEPMLFVVLVPDFK